MLYPAELLARTGRAVVYYGAGVFLKLLGALGCGFRIGVWIGVWIG